MANKYYVPGGTNSWSSTANWSDSATLTPTGAALPSSLDSVFFTSATTYTVINSIQGICLNFNVSAGTVTFSPVATIQVFGNINWTVSVTWTSNNISMRPSTTGTKTVLIAAGSSLNPTFFIFEPSVAATFQLLSNLTLSGTASISLTSSATLQLNGFDVVTPTFNASGTSPGIAFGTNSITISSFFSLASATGTSISGTPTIYATGSVTSLQAGTLSEAQALNVSFTSAVSSTITTFSGSWKNIDFTNYSGALSSFNPIIYGNLTFSSTMTVTATTGPTFAATSGTQNITSNGITVSAITINGVGTTVKLIDALTLNSLRTLTLTNGTLDLDGKILTTGLFSSSNANTRTIAFGAGNIVCNAAGGTLWTTATVTGLTVTGTPVVNISNSGAVATTVASGILTEAQAISFNFTTGAYALTFLGTVNYAARNVNFTGFAGTWAARTVASTIYGNLTLSTGMTFAASSGILTFGATSGTQVVTSNAITVDEPLTFNGVGGTVQLADALLMGTTRILTHTNGTIDLNGKTLTVGTRYLTATGTKNITFNGGTLVCPVSNTTSFNNAAPTGFTTTAGTGTGKISMTGATAKTFVGGGSTFNCTLSNDGAGALTVSGSNTFTAIANGVQPTAFTFTAATTQTVTNWNVSGTAGNLVTIISSTAGVPALLSKASGTVSSNYLSLKDSTALGGAAWYAGTTSTNVSGNLGWIFTAPPATSSNGNFFFMF